MRTVRIVCAVVLSLVLAGVVSMPTMAKKGKGKGSVKAAEGQVRKTDNFVIILDQSNEMNVPYGPKNESKGAIARNIVDQFVAAVPDFPDKPVKGALYIYGVVANEASNTVVRAVKMHDLKKGEYRSAIRQLNNSAGLSTMSWALKMVKDDLEPVGKDRNAIIIISGGNKTDWGKPSHELADLKQTYRENVCIYTILVGKSKDGGRFLKGLVDDGRCGFATSADGLESEKDVRRYAKRIFFKESGDKDNDGVLDAADQCPSTPNGANVDARGCWAINNVNFDSGKSDIKPEFYWILDQIASVLNANPEVSITVVGHTDSVGADDYNMKLSGQRADSVKNYLMTKGEVDGSRLQTRGMGETQPIGDNNSEDGKAMNRRIEFQPSSR